VSVTIAATDNAGGLGLASIDYSVNGGAATSVPVAGALAASSTVVVPDVTTDGTYTVAFTATDVAGNVSAAGTALVKLDTTAPVVAATLAPAANPAGFNASDVTVNIAATDAGGSGVASITYSATGAQPIALTTVAGASASTVVNVDGETTVNYTATDVAGNASSGSILVRRYTAPPTIVWEAIPAPANGSAWFSTPTVSVMWTATAAVPASPPGLLLGIASSLPPFTAAAGNTANGAVVVSGEGPNRTAPLTVTDKAGNTASSTSPLGVNIDLTPPTLTYQAPVPGPNANGWNNTPVTIGFTMADNLSGVAAPPPGSSLAFTAQGQNQTQSVTVTDVAGNVSAPFTSPAVSIDMTQPTLAWGAQTPAPNANGWNNTPVTIPYTTADNLSGVATPPPGSAVTFTATGQAQTQPVTVTDRADNSATFVSPPVNIDLLPPVAAVSPAPNALGWLNVPDTTPVSVVVSDAGPSGLATVSYRLNTPTGPYTPATLVGGQATIPVNNNNGIRTVYINATDRAGNSVAALAVDVKIDRNPPNASSSVSRAQDGAGFWKALPPVTVTINATDGLSGVASITYTDTVNGVPGTPVTVNAASATYTVPATDGAHVITFSATDNAGNVGNVGTRTVSIDGTAPTFTSASVVSPAGGSVARTPTGNQNVTINGSVSEWAATSLASGVGNGTYTIADSNGQAFTGGSLGGVNQTTGAFSFSRNLPRQVLSGFPNRVYTFTLTVTDRAGNAVASPAVVRFTVN
jgi:hypothetical protein